LADRGELKGSPQTGEPSLTRPITGDDLRIDWNWPAQRIVNHVRAFSPRPAARASIEGETVKILRAHVGPDGKLILDELIAPNRGRMSGEAYFRSRLSTRSG
jgi:methionyl-tRNA formyltransferase